jgi:hypothetical protein
MGDVRIPPLNLTEDELVLLRTILQSQVDLGITDPVLKSLKEKADTAHSRAYARKELEAEVNQ